MPPASLLLLAAALLLPCLSLGLKCEDHEQRAGPVPDSLRGKYSLTRGDCAQGFCVAEEIKGPGWFIKWNGCRNLSANELKECEGAQGGKEPAVVDEDVDLDKDEKNESRRRRYCCRRPLCNAYGDMFSPGPKCQTMYDQSGDIPAEADNLLEDVPQVKGRCPEGYCVSKVLSTTKWFIKRAGCITLRERMEGRARECEDLEDDRETKFDETLVKLDGDATKPRLRSSCCKKPLCDAYKTHTEDTSPTSNTTSRPAKKRHSHAPHLRAHALLSLVGLPLLLFSA